MLNLHSLIFKMLKWFGLFSFCLLFVACGGEDVPSAGPLVVAEDSVVGESLLGTATATLVAPLIVEETAVSTPTSPPEPTSVPVEENGEATDEEALPTSLAAGESAVMPLAAGELAAFSFAGTRFEPLLFFVEAAEGLDVSLQIFGERLEGTPLREANFSGNGRSEIMVFSPQTTGTFQVAAQAAAGAGEARIYMYAAGATGVAVSQRDSLAAGEPKVYEVVSKNGRPVIAYVDPIEQEDLQISFADATGKAIAEANFSGAGSAEAAFVLPLETTPYTITISDVNGAEAGYDILIVTLE